MDQPLDAEILKTYVEGESGLSYRRNNRSWIFNCPRCGKKDKLWIRKKDGHFICWFCAEIAGYRGSKPDLALADLSGETLSKIRERLYGANIATAGQLLALKFTGYFNDVDEDKVDDEDFGVEPIWWPYNYYPIDHKKAARGLAYLESRGIPLDIALAYDLRYVPEEQRVVFPVMEDGVLYGYQKRLVIPGGYLNDKGETAEVPKILSSEDLPREKMLMFVDRLKSVEHCVLTEGPVDAIKAHLCGGNVAAMGKAVTRGQLAGIMRPGLRRLYLGLDPDAAQEIMRLIRDAASELEVYVMLARGGGAKADLGAMGFEEVRELFLSAPRVDTRRLFFHFRPLT